MAAALPSSTEQPGRPWNLTAEQEHKLKDFWSLMFKYFDGKQPDQLEEEEEEKSATPRGGGRFSWLRGKSVEKSENEVNNEDKYHLGKGFKKIIAELPPSELRSTTYSMVKCHHPDTLVLRYLRARKWNVSNALVMLFASLRWRVREMRVDQILERGELGYLQDGNEEFMEQCRSHKSVIAGRDNFGRPYVIGRPRFHYPKNQAPNIMNEYILLILETTNLLLGETEDQGSILFDMTGFGLSNMDYASVKFMIACLEAHYPEVLGTLLIHNAPWIFQGIWKIINPWIDPVVARKIQFTNTTADLEKFIPLNQLPAREFENGGNENAPWDYIEPDPQENAKMKDFATRDRFLADREKLYDEFENLTREWIDGKDVNHQRKEVAKKLNRNYWQLDPYIRARGLYDRIGWIKPRPLFGETTI
ncbi:unnamed protein product [Didymodactylos carnosus]|uniref:CRAL-TRIO domain-containing protein n=1 Tax=Didymodactylos carnosus TaxID=1234261 RepID=A0A814K177_9BILA|nr:unnamed protein product [Didymodactylos carnosus]CAF1043088.1 unnamed protein product [Didymodactylos carnosus]CAF3760967.1 unnamed protein product [Didymodactylos carnosus]CAF3813214.1 unnamed protein product [Didymodactylos carnosus]